MVSRSIFFFIMFACSPIHYCGQRSVDKRRSFARDVLMSMLYLFTFRVSYENDQNWMISTSAIYLHRTERFPLAKRRIIVSHAKRGRLLWIRHLGMYLSKTKWNSWEKQDLSACWKKGFCFRKEIETVSEVKLLRATQFDPIFIS